MAYREFRNEKTYAQPDIQGLPMTLQAIQQANALKFQNKKLKADQDKEREAKFKDIQFEKPAEVDLELITKNELSPFIQRMTKHKVAGGHATDEGLVQEQGRIAGLIAKTNTDAAVLKEAKEQVAQYPEWVNKGDATQVMKELYVGEGVDYKNRDTSKILPAIDPRSNPSLFNQLGFVSNALKTMQAQTIASKTSKESGSYDGASTTTTDFSLSTIAGIQFDEKTKTYRIDPARKGQVIGELFNHGGEMGGQTWKTILEKEVEGELAQDVERFVKAEKAKGNAVDPEDVRNQFMLDPSANPYRGGKTIAQQVMDRAEQKVLLQAQLNHQYDYTKTYDQINKESSSEEKKPAVVVTHGWQTGQATGQNVKDKAYNGPGVTFRAGKGTKDVVLTIKSPTTYTVDGGRKDNQKLERTMKTNTAQLMPMTKSGNLVYLKMDDPDTMLKWIEKKTDQEMLNYGPSLQLMFRGTISDKYNTLNDVDDGYDPSDRAARRQNKGATAAMSHELVPADDNILGQLAANGVTKEQLYSDDMKRIAAAWQQRYEQAAGKKPAAKPETKTTTQTPKKDPLGLL